MVAGSLLLSIDSMRLIPDSQLPSSWQHQRRPKRHGSCCTKCCAALVASNDRCREFKLSDFDLHSHVSVGLSGRSDELLFEGTVKNSHSDLKGMRVVLRQLTGERAQRRGKRALEVVSKLVTKEYVLHSYATRVHGFIAPSDQDSLTLVHGYYGCYSLHQWLLCVDWLPNLERRLALDEEAARRVGDDTTGGPEVTRQLRLIRIIMRDILIGVNYLHSQGLAHTELRLNNIHISAADRHVKVGLLANAVKFSEVDDAPVSSGAKHRDTRKQMVAYDMRCVGFVLARMVLRELMDARIFALFKAFMRKGDPAGLREFLLPHFSAVSPSGSRSLQILDRDGGAGWHLLAAMLASDPEKRISCIDALRHPFLCGPRWLVDPSFEMFRWGLGSAAIRIVEEYIYMNHQRNRLAQLIDLLERVNIVTKQAEWRKKLEGRWRLLYSTGRQIGLTRRKASPAVLIGDVYKTFLATAELAKLSSKVDISFKVMASPNWSPDKSGRAGSMQIVSERVGLRKGQRVYQTETEVIDQSPALERLRKQQEEDESTGEPRKRRRKQKKGLSHFLPKDSPKTLPIIRLDVEEFEISMELEPVADVEEAQRVVQEVRIQIPKEVFAVSKLACATYVDSRLLILRGVSGAALMFVRSPLQPI